MKYLKQWPIFIFIALIIHGMAIAAGEISEQPGGARMEKQGNSAEKQEQINRDNEKKMQNEMNKNKGKTALMADQKIGSNQKFKKDKKKQIAAKQPTTAMAVDGEHTKLGPNRPIRPNEGPTRPDRPDTGPSPKPRPDK